MSTSKIRSTFVCIAAALLSTTAQAQLFRAYLAADGSDSNPCTLQAPCRLLPAALNAVAGGGEIWMLDSANYNTATVVISKSVSILAVPGAVGSVVALNGGPAISITDSGLNVALRNLVIGPVAGAAPGTHGVFVLGESSLTIENSLITNLPGTGVRVIGSGDKRLSVANSTLRNNAEYAIHLHNGGRAAISAVQMLENGWGGISAWGESESANATASVSGCVISGGDTGISVYTTVAGAVARISVTNSAIGGTTRALGSRVNGGGTAEVNVGSSMIVDSTYAWYQQGTGAAILSLGNNQMSGNNGSFGVLTPLAPQ